MDARTGELYYSKKSALRAGVPEEDIITIGGNRDKVISVANDVKEARRKKDKAAKKSKKKNRK